MEKNEKELFIVLEEHLSERYDYLINKYNYDSYHVGGFGDIQIGTSLKNLIKRVRHRNILHQEYKKLNTFIKEKLEAHKVEKIFFSNSEGYIAHNFLLKIKVDFPNLQLIGLQHGVFELSEAPKSKSRHVINNFFKYFFGFYPIGAGFGSKIVDKYIVYNDVYRDFLINTFDWSPNNVSSDIKFLKCELYDKKTNEKKHGTTALFLMQCLSKAGMCSDSEENYLNDKVISYLQRKYDKVLIKRHPASKNNLDLVTNSKIKEVSNLVDAFNQSTHAYSFSSTTLLEANIFDIKAYAINSKLVKEDKSIYKIFDNVIIFENEIIT